MTCSCSSVGEELKQEVVISFPKIRSKEFLIILDLNALKKILINKSRSVTELKKNNSFVYKNKHSVKFVCYFSEHEKDIQEIKDWLDQFFLFKICEKGYFICNVQILYAKSNNNYDVFLKNDIDVLVPERFSKKIIKTIKYKTILSASLNENSSVGWIIIRTSIFENSYSFEISIEHDVKKTNILSVFLD